MRDVYGARYARSESPFKVRNRSVPKHVRMVVRQSCAREIRPSNVETHRVPDLGVLAAFLERHLTLR